LFADEEMVLISALQHYLFCPRQCALIHVEGDWHENYLTAAGRWMHERVDAGGIETRRDRHRASAVSLVSRRHGLTGVADVVEFERTAEPDDDMNDHGAIRLPGREGWWRPFPVEYKRGKPKSHQADEVQLCAQALCLEEMLNVRIEKGALFYGETRRRADVCFDESLRALTIETAQSIRRMLDEGVTPEPIVTKGCEACSLIDDCQPHVCETGKTIGRWVLDRVESALKT